MPAILKDIEFSNSHDRLIVTDNVLRVFKKYEQKKRANEAGGILLGYVYRDRTEIMKVTTPSKLDSFGNNFFIRSRITGQAEINNAWDKSNGILIYLGEWHTHSQLNPKPSIVDMKMILKSLMETKMEIDLLYLIIVGQNNTHWVGKQTETQLVELKKNFVDYTRQDLP